MPRIDGTWSGKRPRAVWRACRPIGSAARRAGDDRQAHSRSQAGLGGGSSDAAAALPGADAAVARPALPSGRTGGRSAGDAWRRRAVLSRRAGRRSASSAGDRLVSTRRRHAPVGRRGVDRLRREHAGCVSLVGRGGKRATRVRRGVRAAPSRRRAGNDLEAPVVAPTSGDRQAGSTSLQTAWRALGRHVRQRLGRSSGCSTRAADAEAAAGRPGFSPLRRLVRGRSRLDSSFAAQNAGPTGAVAVTCRLLSPSDTLTVCATLVPTTPEVRFFHNACRERVDADARHRVGRPASRSGERVWEPESSSRRRGHRWGVAKR